jgi:curved DNA-binding protein CbpA
VQDHYGVLGVERESDFEAIKRAWRLKVQLLHPDRHEGAAEEVLAEATRQIAMINTAWNVLKSPESRQAYDRKLADLEAARRVGDRLRHPTTSSRGPVGTTLMHTPIRRVVLHAAHRRRGTPVASRRVA